MFRPVDSRISFPKLENQILGFWRDHLIFQKSVDSRLGANQFTLYEGPPTANGNPGIHHILSRVFKDIIPRYKAMKGFYTPRKAGWDTHGLPVELEIEKNLGFTSKTEIENFGVAKFNALCRESVFNYLKDWEAITERIGYWVDLQHQYVTLDNTYIESCWWVVKKLWDAGLIYQGYKVTPHCPRCGTSLSSHEVALGYKDNTEDPSVYIKFQILHSSIEKGTVLDSSVASSEKQAYLLAWTTTPWTLPGNTALAVSPEAEYSIIEGPDDYLILASALVEGLQLEGYTCKDTLNGNELVDLQYKPLFNPHEYGIDRSRPQAYGESKTEGMRTMFEVQKPVKDLSYRVIAADFVSMDEGTGIVHIAPAFGEADFEVGMSNNLDFVQPVDLDGKMKGTYSFAGKFVKEADPVVLEDLLSWGLLFRSEKTYHTYPFCWRCEAPVLYYAKKTWYIRTTAKKDDLISGNSDINWYPEHIKYGRFGDWLENNVDWAFSRERYWGTPLSVWNCSACGNHECVGSTDELKAKPGIAGLVEPLDLHRPYVDDITFTCSNCGGTMKRQPEVIDCWFDSGAMPVAQWHYPFENQDVFERSFPADYICEAVDQTRGWFYSLHALSTLLFGKPCYKNVICLGHILDAQGEKMSKAKGNVVDPWTVIDNYGADAVRWYLITSSPAGNVRRFSGEMVGEVLRNILMTFWNIYSFFITYANIDNFDPQSQITAPVSDLDKWILSRLNLLVSEVDNALENYDPTLAGRKIEIFVNELSNWYVRRSRRRFWKSQNDSDKLSAYSALYQCLVTLSKLAAPLIPFVTEEIYQNLVRSVDGKAPESVHMTDFPIADHDSIDKELNEATNLVMTICSLGRAARAKSGIKVRQPLSKVVIKTRSKADNDRLNKLAYQVLDELNVKGMEFVEKEIPQDTDGYISVTEGDYWVAVATELSPELEAEGAAREIVRRLQTMRRSADLNITDNIIVYYQEERKIQQVVEQFDGYIKQETLALELTATTQIPDDGIYTEKCKLLGLEILFGIKKQSN
jgi:isoleucyl-tRNA synthetase